MGGRETEKVGRRGQGRAGEGGLRAEEAQGWRLRLSPRGPAPLLSPPPQTYSPRKLISISFPPPLARILACSGLKSDAPDVASGSV